MNRRVILTPTRLPDAEELAPADVRVRGHDLFDMRCAARSGRDRSRARHARRGAGGFKALVEEYYALCEGQSEAIGITITITNTTILSSEKRFFLLFLFGVRYSRAQRSSALIPRRVGRRGRAHEVFRPWPTSMALPFWPPDYRRCSSARGSAWHRLSQLRHHFSTRLSELTDQLGRTRRL